MAPKELKAVQSTSAMPTTLEPKLSLTRTCELREVAVLTSKMAVRQKLRQELRQLQPFYPDPTSLDRIPHAKFVPSSQRVSTFSVSASPSAAAAAATAHLGLTAPTANTALLPASPARLVPPGSSGQQAVQVAAAQQRQYGFHSKTSAETLAGVGGGSASGSPSPHPPLIHAITPYGPGSGPLASLPARRRSADVLFAGAATAATAAASIKDIPTAVTAAGASCNSNGNSRGASPTAQRLSQQPPAAVAALAQGTLASDAVNAAMAAALAAQPRINSRAPSPELLRRSITAETAAAVASVAVAARPISPSHALPSGTPPITLTSPALRSISPGRGCASPAAATGTASQCGSLPGSRSGPRPGSKSGMRNMVASNFGFVPLSELQQAGGPGTGGVVPGEQADASSMAAAGWGGGAHGEGSRQGSPGARHQQHSAGGAVPVGSPARPGSGSQGLGSQAQGLGQGGGRTGSAGSAGAASAAASYAAAVAKGAARRVDKATGQTHATIHKHVSVGVATC